MAFTGQLARDLDREGFVRWDDGTFRKGDVQVVVEDDEAPETRVTVFDHDYPDVVAWDALLSGAPARVVAALARAAAQE